MGKYLTIGEAAKKIGVTSETLRHYDRIGIVSPTRRDAISGYRYYTEEDVIQLSIVRLMQNMDMSLSAIERVLALKDLPALIKVLDDAETRADVKIKELQKAKEQIAKAKASYISKLHATNIGEALEIREFEERVILLSSTLKEPSVENLYSYQKSYWKQLPPEKHKYFSFVDEAGIYSNKDKTALYIPCIKYQMEENIRILPKGKYLCLHSSDESIDETVETGLALIQKEYGIKPGFLIRRIVITGILSWDYEVQIPFASK